MTHFLQDILRQPQELERSISYLSGAGRDTLQAAAGTIQKARHVYLTGIGSSWHAAFGAGAIFSRAGRPVYMQDAGNWCSSPLFRLVRSSSQSPAAAVAWKL